jgi:hypothetical protein
MEKTMKKRFKITSPIILAILCAVGVHTVLFTDNGHRLQSAIVESDTTSHAEAHLVADKKSVAFKVNVTATNVTKIEGTLVYDDESIILSNPISSIGTVSIVDQDFAKKVAITFQKPTNIQKGDTLITWTMTPVLPEVHSINLTDVTITMTDGANPLTTEGTGEF